MSEPVKTNVDMLKNVAVIFMVIIFLVIAVIFSLALLNTYVSKKVQFEIDRTCLKKIEEMDVRLKKIETIVIKPQVPVAPSTPITPAPIP